jgi:two-component system cell cycle response regulator DivK
VTSEPARLPDDKNPGQVDAASSSGRRDARVILVVDDTSDTRDIYSLYLSSKGFKVPTARDGISGLEAASVHQPDVIVMDLSMPGVDGIEATRRLKADPRTSHIPVVLLTAYPLNAVQGGALEAGADDFLTKPCLPDKLERHVRRLLARRRPGRGPGDARSSRRRGRR